MKKSSMKKSMVVTTVLMVLLLVVALSTATFAWYTAQSNVSATDTTVYSASASAASLALDKTNTGASASAASVTITMNSAIAPMVPKVKPSVKADSVAATTYAAFSVNGFTQASINNDGNFTSDGTPASPALIKSVAVGSGAGSEQADFYVINTNGTNNAVVQVAVNINTDGHSLLTSKPNDWKTNYTQYKTRSGAGTDASPYVYTALTAVQEWADNTYYVSNSVIAEDLRVAVFGDGAYIGTWASTAANTYYGTIQNGENGTSSLSTYAATASGTPIDLKDIPALGACQIQVCAWFDGVGLVIDDSSMPAVFNIAFSIKSGS